MFRFKNIFNSYYWYQQRLRLRIAYRMWKASKSWYDYQSLYQYMYIFADEFIKAEKVTKDDNRAELILFWAALGRLIKNDYDLGCYEKASGMVRHEFKPDDQYPQYLKMVTTFNHGCTEEAYKNLLKYGRELEERGKSSDLKTVGKLFTQYSRSWWD